MTDSQDKTANGEPGNGFATGSIALLWITFVVGLNSVALLFLVCTRFLVGVAQPEWELDSDPLDFLWGIGLAIVAVRLRLFHVAYLDFLQREKAEKFQAELGKLCNTIGCFCAILMVYEIAFKVWLVWDIWSTPGFIPGADS